MHRCFAIAAAALVLGSAGIAQAQSEPVSVKVPYGDLDLSGSPGRAVLQIRIAHAIDVICGERPAPFELQRIQDHRACRRSALASADSQLASLSGVKLAQSAIVVRPRGH